jgi:hypothetical protein
MADPILLVQGDTGPQIKVTLTREDSGLAENLAGATVSLHFKKKNTDTVLFTLTGQNTPDEELEGIAFFVFANGQLNLDAGKYVGEVEVVFESGTRETVYEIIEFTLREDFA